MNLEAYPKIGWDFDGTLIEHHNSSKMHQYIISHPEQKHIIITFRSHGWVNHIPQDIERLYPNTELSLSHFDSIFNMSDELADNVQIAQYKMYSGILTNEDRQAITDYITWKGLMCHNLGIPVLIDDNFPHTTKGCEKYKIDLIHPDDFDYFD